jgi:hypothetical protein
VDPARTEQVILVTATDTASDLVRYRVKINDQEPVDINDEERDGQITLPALPPGYYSLIVEVFDEAGNSSFAPFSLSIEAFEPPRLVDIPTSIPAGVIPVLKGTTRPNSQVTVAIAVNQSAPLEYTVSSDETGAFAFVPPQAWEAGVIALTARAVDENGAQSLTSDVVRVAIEEPGIVRIGQYVVSVLSVVVSMLALLLLCGALAVYLVRQTRRLRRRMRRESSDVHQVVVREFAQLRDQLSTLSEIPAPRRTAKGAAKDQENLSNMMAALKLAEENVLKEVRDIERLVK